ncbi:NUDIX hydrolase [Staphylococcus sp. SQ8-PEA]|uniref:NUDIX hydrolase n=1 Tax=Staphylococcus marylandisciuri TaxID=2981529 RepID=A0ABT2QNA5_9STAP|nr:NUDIX hydrolase [Staphylococcus marylandisciuri]MCU5745458.1 NUDIX hydrolase [Staphylococcus marylandisciuri]
MEFNEKTISKESIYQGKIIDLEVHEVELINGESSKRELVFHNGAVAVCALTPDNKIVLVKQFRKPCEKPLLEIPAGKLDQGENREEAAARELEEETGYRAKSLQWVTDMYGSPGFSNERLSIYFADQLEKGDMHPDEDEFIEIQLFSIEEIAEMLQRGELEDAKTIIALQHMLLNYNHSK